MPKNVPASIQTSIVTNLRPLLISFTTFDFYTWICCKSKHKYHFIWPHSISIPNLRSRWWIIWRRSELWSILPPIWAHSITIFLLIVTFCSFELCFGHKERGKKKSGRKALYYLLKSIWNLLLRTSKKGSFFLYPHFNFTHFPHLLRALSISPSRTASSKFRQIEPDTPQRVF